MIKKTYILFIVFLLNVCFLDSYSQPNVTDSLLKELKNTKTDTSKAFILQDLGMSLYLSNPNEAMRYWQWNVAFIDSAIKHTDSLSYKALYQTKAYSLGSIAYINQTLGKIDEAIANNNDAYLALEKLGDKKGMGEILNNIGIIYMNRGDLPLAINTYKKCAALFIEAEHYAGFAMASQNLALIFKNQGKISQAISLYNLSMRVRSSINDSLGLGHSYYELAIIYRLQNENPKAKEYFEKSISIRKQIQDIEGLGNSLNELGALLMSENKYTEAKNLFLEGIGFLNQVSGLGGLSFAYSNLGTLSLELQQPDSAIVYFNKALDYRIQNNDMKGKSLSFYLLGNAWLIKKDLTKAEQFGLQSYELANKFGFMETKQKASGLLSKVYERKGDYKKSLAFHQEYKQWSDSLLNKNTQKKALIQQMNFEFDKKQSLEKINQEKKNALAREEIKQQKQQRNYFIVGFVLVLLLAIFIYKGYRQKQKANKELDLKNTLIEHQKELVVEKQKEILDSINYAQRIQKALLANDKFLSTHLPNHFVFFRPKDIVSGDFYWASKLHNNQFALVTADSTGHGVPGAIMSMLNISCLIEAIEAQGLSEPKDILNYTRSKIIKQLTGEGNDEDRKDGMDCSLISFDFEKLTLTYSAANNPVWIVRNKELIELKPDKMPVGKHEKESVSFSQSSIQLQKNDMVYTLTDGMPDQFGGPKGKKFLYKTLKDLLVNLSHLPIDEQKPELETIFLNWKGDLEQVDDVLIIGVRV